MAVTAPTASVAENYEKYAMYFDSSATKKDELSMDTFYKLLTAEMTNQDPMEPMSNTEFISQMASMTSLKTQQDALYYNNANYAASLVGKTVTAAAMSGTEMKSDTGVVTSMNLSGGSFRVKVNGTDYLLSNIMEVLPAKNPYEASSQDAAYATALIGKQVTVTSKNSSGDSVVETGTVERIEIKDGAVNVVVNGLAFPLSGVVKAENAASGSGTPGGTNAGNTASTQDIETSPVAPDGTNAGNTASTQDTETSPIAPGGTNAGTDADNTQSPQTSNQSDGTNAADSEALRQLFE
jgi:flagellar basal-body rod modification protein FlgD